MDIYYVYIYYCDIEAIRRILASFRIHILHVYKTL